MNESTFFQPLELILPESKHNNGYCLEQLQTVLQEDVNINKVHLEQNKETHGICVHYNPDLISLEQLQALIKLAGAKIAQQYQHETLFVSGMDSPDCANVIEHNLSHLDGVLAAKVSYAAQQLRLEFDAEKIQLKTIQKRIKLLGYQAKRTPVEPSFLRANYELILSCLAGFLLLFGWYFSLLPLVILSFISGGILTFRDSIQTLIQKRFDIDVLMVVAAIGAASLGAFAEGALLLFLFSLGHALEHKALDKARHAVTALADLTPKVATVLRDGNTIEIATEELQIDDQVMVKPGQHIPCDGIIQQGHSAINQASITGESIPVNKTAGDSVFAGTINGHGQLTITVNKLAKESTLSRMVRLVLEANTQKSPTERFTEQFVKYFVPAILLFVAGLIVIPPLLGESFHDAFYRAMAVLVAASPCALAIATPAAVLSAVAHAARGGVLIKGGMHLEHLSAVKAIAFDKTGTLTQGKPKVTSIIAVDTTEDKLLTIAASIEQLSDHPLAKAIVNEAKDRQLPLSEVTDMQAVIGQGIQGILDNQSLKVGNLNFFDQVPISLHEQVKIQQNSGQTVMIVQHGENYLGVIGLADTKRSEAAETINTLHTMGIQKTIMLTGDHERVAKAIATQVGIDEVLAGLLPEEKLTAITTLEEQYQSIAMIGDGINDAPAMARATVGIAMGGAGSDVALEASDIALMADDLSRLPFAVKLARRAERVIRQNLFLSLTVVILLLFATAFDIAGIGIAVLIHEGSTLLVVANALRLLK